MTGRLAIAVLGLAATAAPGEGSAPGPGGPAVRQIVGVERAFAAMAVQRGLKAAFLGYAAEDAVAITPKVESGRAKWLRQDPGLGPPYLTWRPIWAGAARSGDLGFSLGPWSYGQEAFGYYFTLWRREPDGSWKWLIDQGSPLDHAAAVPAGAPVVLAPSYRGPAEDSAQALAAAARLDDRLNDALLRGEAGAYGALVAQGARAMGFGPLTVGRAAVLRAVAARPAPTRAARLGAYVSKAGDLALTYGEMTVRAPGHEDAVYVRVWQAQDRGWRLLFDELVSRNRSG